VTAVAARCSFDDGDKKAKHGAAGSEEGEEVRAATNQEPTP